MGGHAERITYNVTAIEPRYPANRLQHAKRFKLFDGLGRETPVRHWARGAWVQNRTDCERGALARDPLDAGLGILADADGDFGGENIDQGHKMSVANRI